MKYKYLLEDNANKYWKINENEYILHILCYHIEEQTVYPFLSFMMDKIPFCNNIVTEQLTLPYVFINNTNSIEDIIMNKIKLNLQSIGCDFKLTNNMYKGIIFSPDGNIPYALVNISGINIHGLKILRQSVCWFALPTEIINMKHVCNINIDHDVSTLFNTLPQIGCLFNYDTKKNYILPDVAYTTSDFKLTTFQSVFGNTQKKVYYNCSKYYFFHRSFFNSIDYIYDKTNKSTELGINRYALFVEGNIHWEKENEFMLTDNEIKQFYPEQCIIICFDNENIKNYDILVKNYDSFVSLSYHKLENIEQYKIL